MRPTAYSNYLENEILSADPLKLVQLLYRGALDAIGSARRYLAAGDIQARSRVITKGIDILTELIHSLDHTRGGELSQNLLRVYDYAQRLLIDANGRQIDAPLAEAERLLSTLLQAWQETAWQQTQPADAEEYHKLSCA